MNRSLTRALLALLLMALSHPALAIVSGNWDIAVELDRSLNVDEDVDPQQFAQQHNIQHAVVRNNPDGSHTISFNWPGSTWDKFQQDVCGLPGVRSCGDNVCQEFLEAEPLSGRVTRDSSGPVAGARLVLSPRAPDVSTWAAEDDEGDEADAPSAPGTLRCDFSGVDPGQGPVTATADGAGNISSSIPAGLDPGCWEVTSGSACEADARPLNALLPEREPDKVLAVFDVSVPGSTAGVQGIAADLAQQAGAQLLDVTELASAGIAVARFQLSQPGVSPEGVASQFSNDPRVLAAQPEYRYRTAADDADPFAWMAYGDQDTGVAEFRQVTQGDTISVAVIDTGIDTTHPELKARIATVSDFTGFGMSPDRHGTAVAGIIAAESGNGIGALGVSPGVSLLGFKACQPESPSSRAARCWTSTLAKALNAALASDAAIINMSLVGPQDPLLERLLDRAASGDKLVVAAAGNDGAAAPPSFPASHPAVLAVTAVDAQGAVYSRAVQGEFVDLAAPGVQLPAPSPGEDYPAVVTGTSIAAAYTSGAAALLLAIAPDQSPDDMRQRLRSGATDLGPARPDPVFGAGRLDLCGAAEGLGGSPAGCSN